VLNDIEFFVTTWLLLVLSCVSLFVLIFSSAQLNWHKIKQWSKGDDYDHKIRWSEMKARRARIISALAMVISSFAGMTVNYLSYFPPINMIIRHLCLDCLVFNLTSFSCFLFLEYLLSVVFMQH
jgi:hypothetical protein